MAATPLSRAGRMRVRATLRIPDHATTDQRVRVVEFSRTNSGINATEGYDNRDLLRAT